MYVSDSKWKVDATYAGLIAVASSAFLMWAAGDLFPTMEYRDWLAWADRFDPLATGARMLLRRDWFSRDFSMSYVHASSLACGIHLRCLNAWMLFPIAVSASLLYLLARSLGSTVLVAIAMPVMWLLSWPMLDALAWQATIHDRWACAFVLAALWLAVARYGRDKAGGAHIVTSVAGLLLVWLASNCKEASWFLAPTMAFIAYAAGSGNWRQRLRGTSVAWLPLAYLVWHVAAFVVASHSHAVANASGAVWLQHVGSGDMLKNAKIFSGALLGLTPSPGSIAVFIFVIAMTMALDVRWLETRQMNVPDASSTAQQCPLFPLWPLVLGLLGAIAIPARTVAPSPYYMLIPGALFPLLLLEGVRRTFTRSGSARKRTFADGLALSVALLLIAIFSISSKPKLYREFREQSQNFRATLERLATLPDQALQETPYFLHHPAAIRAPYLLSTVDWKSLWRLISGSAARTEPPWLNQPVKWQYAWGPVERKDGDRRTYVYMDAKLKLINFEVASSPRTGELGVRGIASRRNATPDSSECPRGWPSGDDNQCKYSSRRVK